LIKMPLESFHPLAELNLFAHAHEQVNVLRHQHVTTNRRAHFHTAPRVSFKGVLNGRIVEQPNSHQSIERDEVKWETEVDNVQARRCAFDLPTFHSARLMSSDS